MQSAPILPPVICSRPSANKLPRPRQHVQLAVIWRNSNFAALQNKRSRSTPHNGGNNGTSNFIFYVNPPHARGSPPNYHPRPFFFSYIFLRATEGAMSLGTSRTKRLLAPSRRKSTTNCHHLTHMILSPLLQRPSPKKQPTLFRTPQPRHTLVCSPFPSQRKPCFFFFWFSSSVDMPSPIPSAPCHPAPKPYVGPRRHA